MKNITPSNEDYLEAILMLSEADGSTRCVNLAEQLSVSRASVTKAMQGLRDAGLIEQQPYGLVSLTKTGSKVALGVMSRHKSIKAFLMKILGVDEDTAEADACRIEHVISEKTMERMIHYLLLTGE